MFEIRDGNQIKLLGSGTAMFDELIRMIDVARHTIHITTFILGDDSVAQTIVEHLNRKSRAGVTVRFLIDGFGALLTDSPSLIDITEAGGQVAWYWGRLSRRNHRKIIVVDGEEAMVGGMNLAEEYMGPTELKDRWNDLTLVLSGAVVADLETVFRADWKSATGESIFLAVVPADRRGRDVAKIVASKPGLWHDDLLTLLSEAKQRIWIATPYFIPDESITRALVLASRRGVDVQILVPRRSNHWLADLGRGRYLRLLQKEGTTIHLHEKMMHAKAVSIDDLCAVVGSANTDRRSLFFNFEISVFLYSRENIEALANWYMGLVKESHKGYPRAAFGAQVVEGFIGIFSPLL